MSLLTDRQVILASASPRRLELLRQVGVEPRLLPLQIEERQELGRLTPLELVLDNACRKARAAARQLGSVNALILGADTVVVSQGQVLGKPANPAEAAAMLFSLSGATHSVFTGQCLIDGANGRERAAGSETRVSFRQLSQEEILAYVAGGEPLDKAGAYGVQGQAGLFVTAIAGDYSTVVGLSLPLLYTMVRDLTRS